MLSVDWRVSLKDVRKRIGHRLGLQGNLDPGLLLGHTDRMLAQTRRILEEAGPRGHYPEPRTRRAAGDTGRPCPGSCRFGENVSARGMNPGVLLFNLGGPETLDDVKPFLYNLFKDPEILRIRWGPLRNTLAYVIATLRRRTSEGYYRQIGGSSPLRRITTEQAEALRKELASHGSKVETFVAMSSWHPFFEEAIASVEDRAINRLVVLPLFPQYSATTTGSGFSSIRRLIEDRPLMKKVDVRWVLARWA